MTDQTTDEPLVIDTDKWPPWRFHDDVLLVLAGMGGEAFTKDIVREVNRQTQRFRSPVLIVEALYRLVRHGLVLDRHRGAGREIGWQVTPDLLLALGKSA